MSGKGGARHFAKPYIDPDIVFKTLSDNAEVMGHLGAYENISRQNAPDPKGVLHCSKLLMDLLGVSETAEIHPSSLKKGLHQFLVQNPDANTSRFSGEVWINLRTERMTVLLFHVRRLAQGTGLHQAAAKLTKNEYRQLQEILAVVKAKEPEVPQKEPDTIAKKPRSLKKGDSDASGVSMDASGFPCMFASPSSSSKPLKKAENPESLEKGTSYPKNPLKKEKASPKKPLKKEEEASPKKPLKKEEEASPKKPLKKEEASLEKGEKRRHEIATAWSRGGRMRRESLQNGHPDDKDKERHQESLTHALGYKPLKRPAGALKKAKEPLKKGEANGSTHWYQVKKTVAKKPKPRAYLTGSLEKGGKFKLIVEVTHQRSPHYLKVIDTIKEKLEQEHLTKEAALALRESLCSE